MTSPPATYCVAAAKACDQLDHADMVALAGMFCRWAIYETDVTPERRTELIKYSAASSASPNGWEVIGGRGPGRWGSRR